MKKTIENLFWGFDLLDIRFNKYGSFEMKERGITTRMPTDFDLVINKDDKSKTFSVLEALSFDIEKINSGYEYYPIWEYPECISFEMEIDGKLLPINIHFEKDVKSEKIDDLTLISWKKEALEKREKTSDILDVYYIEYKKEISVEVAEKIATFAKKRKISKLDAIHHYELFSQL